MPQPEHPPRRPSGPAERPLRPLAGFILRFVGGWIAVFALTAWVPGLERWAVTQTVASLEGAAKLIHLACRPAGSLLTLGGAQIEIIPDCTPLMPIAALWIAIFAFPASWRWKLWGFTVGAVVLWVYNLLRILALVPVLLWRPGWFEFIHIYLWQTLTLLIVFALFVAWLGAQRRAVPPPAGGARA
jgi:exosortase/archaeosortase family protein